MKHVSKNKTKCLNNSCRQFTELYLLFAKLSFSKLITPSSNYLKNLHYYYLMFPKQLTASKSRTMLKIISYPLS